MVRVIGQPEGLPVRLPRVKRSGTRGIEIKKGFRPNGAADYPSPMAGTFHNLKFHLVFSTKHRERWLTKDLRPRVWEYLGGTLRSEGAKLLAIGGVEDHVHFLFGWRTDEAISVLLRNLKANSSKWIHQTFPGLAEFRWQEGYAIFSVSESQVDRVVRYIASQEEHHRVKSFQEELIEFLKAHNLPYDGRYLNE